MPAGMRGCLNGKFSSSECTVCLKKRKGSKNCWLQLFRSASDLVLLQNGLIRLFFFQTEPERKYHVLLYVGSIIEVT